jgi:hypothetical protein
MLIKGSGVILSLIKRGIKTGFDEFGVRHTWG